MSYSFTVLATRRIREQFDDVVVAQPSHAADKEAAVVAAQTLVRLLVEPKEGEEIWLEMNGSLGWKSDSPEDFLHANVSIRTSLRRKS